MLRAGYQMLKTPPHSFAHLTQFVAGLVEGRGSDAKHGLAGREFRLTKFFYFCVRRYSGVSCLQVCRKLAAGRELSHGPIQVASEYRLGGGTLFARREALFVTSSRAAARLAAVRDAAELH